MEITPGQAELAQFRTVRALISYYHSSGSG